MATHTNVYAVLHSVDYEGDTLMGIFSTRRKATKYIESVFPIYGTKRAEKLDYSYNIERVKLDDTGEK